MKMTGISVKDSHKAGDVVFSEGDHARHFYILLKGCVKLSIGKTGRVVYTIDGLGEAFGWSSLVGRDVYSASAQCVAPTELYKIDREDFQRILHEDTTNGLTFFKHLAGTLGERLISNYDTLGVARSSDAHSTHGTSETLQQMNGE
jgi:CRP-like cAMP-binding protein